MWSISLENLAERTSALGERRTLTINERLSEFFDLASTVAAAFFIFVLFAFALRGVEIFMETQFQIQAAEAGNFTRAELREQYRSVVILRDPEKITMTRGEERIYRIGFKNTGVATWSNSGPRFISIYTAGPSYRKSAFRHSAWRLEVQPAVLKDRTVPPGTVGFLEFMLQAPEEPGKYREDFHLAAEDLLWIPGGGFSIEITVQDAPKNAPNSAVNSSVGSKAAESAPAPAGYGATLLLRSHKKEILLGPGEEVEIILGYKNSGTEAWSTRVLRPAGVALAVSIEDFRHLSWVSSREVVRENDLVLPGQIGFVKFKLRGPNRKGAYEPRFQLEVNDGITVPGSEINIPISVTADGAAAEAPALLPQVEIIPEPILRVGLFHTREPILVIADGTYAIHDERGLIAEVPHGQPSKFVFDFNYGTYAVNAPSGVFVGRGFVRLLPGASSNVFTIVNYENRPGWNKSLNDNQFRGIIELRRAPATGRLWVIEELPIERYLYGIAETSNNTETDFQKALATAARTYAFYHFSRNTKHGGVFHVDSEYDQVYRGYGSEIRMPNWKQSVDGSRGVIVSYQNEIAITPYYSRSDGRTRAWEEVWGGSPKPWLRSVPAPYDAGKTLWGHGVGMSARDALLRARDGADWQNVLKHYYTGVELQKRWN